MLSHVYKLLSFDFCDVKPMHMVYILTPWDRKMNPCDVKQRSLTLFMLSHVYKLLSIDVCNVKPMVTKFALPSHVYNIYFLGQKNKLL